MYIISIQIVDAADTKAANNRRFAGVNDITPFFDFLITQIPRILAPNFLTAQIVSTNIAYQ